jgi:DNA repair protein RecN (Recombination protein N)
MLRLLRIRHLAVIEAMDVEFDSGLSAITGETGAGKSVLVDAVGVLLGARASADMVRTGEAIATVEAIFENAAGNDVLIRREITNQGRSRSFVDGMPATAASLRVLNLVDIHAQHEHQALLDPLSHLPFVDDYGRLTGAAATAAAVWARVQAAREMRDRSQMDFRERTARLELVGFQLGEIEAAQVQPGEDEELQAAKRMMVNATRLRQLSEEAYEGLYEGDGAVLAGLAGVWKKVGELESLDGQFSAYLAARDGIKAQLEDLAEFLRRYSSAIDASPERLQQAEDRLAQLDRLKRKYGPSLADVLQRGRLLKAEHALLDGSSLEGDRVKAELAQAEATFLDVCRVLSVRRREAARTFEADVAALLGELAMARTRFEVRFTSRESDPDSWSERGIDDVEFFVSPNPGEDVRPLGRVVSGGELSRVMLALKTLAARSGSESATGTLVFDEVDAGIGGRVAHVVGRNLKELSRAVQVICITHLPQIAAQAAAHYRLEKTVIGDRTYASVRRLSEAERVEEIARMLAGECTSDSARDAARELLSNGYAGRTRAKGKDKAKGESESVRPRR